MTALFRRSAPVRRRRRVGGKTRLFIAFVIVVVSLISYYRTREYNPVTDEVQHVSLTVNQEIAMGLQATPELTSRHGGLHRDPQARSLVETVGNRLVARSAASQTPYEFRFHLLADEQTINAFALPGGQVFMTYGLFRKLRTEGELAGVLGHEIGHVVARHGAEHIAKAKLTQGLTGAAVIATYDPNDPSSHRTAAMAALIGQLVNMRFGREDEIESDRLGVRFTTESSYDPRSMIGVMEVLAEAGKGRTTPEFFSTHPNPERRIERIQEAIASMFPQGIPSGLDK